MAFNGIFPAKDIRPASFGLLSVADRVLPTDDRWIRGFSSLFLSRPQQVQLLSKYEGPVTNGVVYTPTDALARKQYEDIDPFFIEVQSKYSGLNVNGMDLRGNLLKQIVGVTQKAVEYELWTGATIIEDGRDQTYLTKNTSTEVTTAPVTPRKALSLIEGAIGLSPVGSGGVIHVTRELGSILTLNGSLKAVDDHLETVLGTPVIVGSGYQGTAPGGTGPATGETWMYATGPVSVILGDPEVVNEDMNRSFTPSTNDVFMTALRAASVYVDPSIFYAAQITLPDAP